MFITRASRHDRADLAEFLESHGWHDRNLSEGVAFIARDGKIAGCVRLIEVAPQTLVVDDLLVREDKRGQGLGDRLLQSAMNSRGGTLYVASDEEHVSFYERFDFSPVPENTLPEPVTDFLKKVGDYPAQPGHVDTYLKAR